MKISSYSDWIHFLFNRSEQLGDWRFSDETDRIEIDPQNSVHYFRQMLANFPNDLSTYSNWQLAMGFSFVLNNSFSNVAFDLRDGPLPLALRLEAIKSIKHLYCECFNKRCDPILAHLNEDFDPLNEFCYMLWDTTPLSYCEENPDKFSIYEAIHDVLNFALTLPNIACLESAIHGLSEISRYHKQATVALTNFILSRQTRDKPLIDYAIAAKDRRIN